MHTNQCCLLTAFFSRPVTVACTERTMQARDEVYKVPLKAAEAMDAASGLAKVTPLFLNFKILECTCFLGSVSLNLCNINPGAVLEAVRSFSRSN